MANETERTHGYPCEGLVRVEEQQQMFRWWQETQNGTLKDIRAALERLDKKMDDKWDALSQRLDAKVAGAERPQTELQTWVRNSLLGLLIFVAGLLANHLIS